MEQIIRRSGRALPVIGNDIDTDRIIPARYMKSVTFTGLGAFAFYDERFDESGRQKTHPFNDDRYRGATILVANKNFGCGSSREHAPQALMDYGIRAIVGESFAEIFAGNCTAMGIPAVSVSSDAAATLQKIAAEKPETEFEIDLEQGRIIAGGFSAPITLPESYRKALIDGSWDSTSLLLQAESEIDMVESALHYRFS